MLSVDEVVKRLADFNPKDIHEVMQDCGLTLKYIGDGAFRWVYKVVGTQAVIKIPKKPLLIEDRWVGNVFSHVVESSEDIRHANTEFKMLQRMKRSKVKYKLLQPHLPEFYHFNKATGISLVKKYNKVPSGSQNKPIRLIAEKVANCLNMDDWDTDLHGQNFGVDKDGTLKLIDLGCLE